VRARVSSTKTLTCAEGLLKAQAEWLLAELQKQFGK
jgi:hypothetical protein